MLVAIFPLLLALLGLVLWLATTNNKLCEIGKICFAVGLLVLTIVLADYTVRIGAGSRGVAEATR